MARAWIFLCVFLQPIGAQTQDAPLNQHLSVFRFSNVSRADALFRLAQMAALPMGLEYASLADLTPKIAIDRSNATIESVLRELTNGTNLVWSLKDGVLLVSDKRVQGRQTPLDRVIPEFLSQEPARIHQLSNLLWMNYQLELNPTLQGFAGSQPAPQTQKLGPIHLNNKSVREILNYLVSLQGNAGWVAQVAENGPKQQTWRIVIYDPEIKPLSELCCAADQSRILTSEK
jgi:hypothetical protein